MHAAMKDDHADVSAFVMAVVLQGNNYIEPKKLWSSCMGLEGMVGFMSGQHRCRFGMTDVCSNIEEEEENLEIKQINQNKYLLTSSRITCW